MFSYRASFASLFCIAVWELNDVIPCSITEQCTPFYVLTVYCFPCNRVCSNWKIVCSDQVVKVTRKSRILHLVNTYSMNTYVLLHFEHNIDVTIIVKLLYRGRVALWSLTMIVRSRSGKNCNAQARCLVSIQANQRLLLLLLLRPSTWYENENGHAQEVLSVEGLNPGLAGCCFCCTFVS